MCDIWYDDFLQVCKEVFEQNYYIDEFIIIWGFLGFNVVNLIFVDCYFVQCDLVVFFGSFGWCGLEIVILVKLLSFFWQCFLDFQCFFGYIRNWNVDVVVIFFCGLYVYVGQSGDGIMLEIVKRMVMFVVLFEVLLLMKLVSLERIDSKFFCLIIYFLVLMNCIILV